MSAKDEYLPFFDEPVMNIRDYRSAVWRTLPPKEQEEWIEEVFDYYRNHHGFPYYELSDSEVEKELWKLRNRKARVDDSGVIKWDLTANTLCTFFFPHIWQVRFRNRKTAWEAFHDDTILKDGIRLCFRIKQNVSPGALVDAFTLGTRHSIGVVSRFKPMAAKAVWERYAPEGGLCYDYACGWGGRLLGCMASKKKLRYVGVDPESRTNKCLLDLSARIRAVYGAGIADVHSAGSEEYCPPELHESIDVAFSSPPYFDLEDYSSEPSQSHLKFPDIESWLDGFLGATFLNIRTMLKPGGVLALNLLDYEMTDSRKADTNIVEGALERIHALGFEPLEKLGIQMVQRKGQGQQARAYKLEPVYVFLKKPS